MADSYRPAGTIRVAAVLFLVSIGVALTTPLILVSYTRNGYLPSDPFDFGIQFLAGPFEDLGEGPFIALGIALTVLSILDVVAGVWLWVGRRAGGVLGVATSVPMFVMGIGFAVPFLLVVTVVRMTLILSGWSSLRPHEAERQARA